jgi:hypothetical protein
MHQLNGVELGMVGQSLGVMHYWTPVEPQVTRDEIPPSRDAFFYDGKRGGRDVLA